MLPVGSAAVLLIWLAAGLTSATLTPRQSYACGDNTTFTTAAGLEFDVYPCTRNIGVGNTIYEADVANITECFNTCVHTGTGETPCVAIVYNIAEKHCWIVDNTLNSTSQLGPDDTLHTALVSDFSAFENLNNACTYSNLSTQATPNNLLFEIFCDTNIGANIDPWLTNPTNQSTDIHAATFSDCMTFCSTMSPKCYGVTYEPAMPHGYHNCFPKGADVPAAAAVTAGTSNLWASSTSHVALALFEPNINTTCGGGNNYTTTTGTNEITFSMSCDVAATGQNLTARYAPDFGTCMDDCAAYTQECVAALYQPSGADGYENCYLKGTVESNGPRSEWRLGLRLDGSGRNVSGISNETDTQTGAGTGESGGGDSGGGGGGGGSRAWIAGPVVGAVVVVAAVVAGYFFWWRRRKGGSRYRAGAAGSDAAADADSKSKLYKGDGATAGNGAENNAELDATFTERKELGSGQPLMAMMRPGHAEREGRVDRADPAELEGSEGRWQAAAANGRGGLIK